MWGMVKKKPYHVSTIGPTTIENAVRGLNCNQSVGKALHVLGKITQDQYNLIFNETKKCGEWVSQAPEGIRITEENIKNLPKYAVIAIKKERGFTPWSHIMLSAGNGKAWGNNNSCVFSKSTLNKINPNWPMLNLEEAEHDPDAPLGDIKGSLIMYYRQIPSAK